MRGPNRQTCLRHLKTELQYLFLLKIDRRRIRDLIIWCMKAAGFFDDEIIQGETYDWKIEGSQNNLSVTVSHPKWKKKIELSLKGMTIHG